MSDKRILQAGAILIGLAILLRLTLNAWQPVLQSQEPPLLGQVLFFLHSGKVVPVAAPTEAEPEDIPQTPLPQPQSQPVKAVFSQGDAALVSLRNTSGKQADVPAALLDSLQWNLYADQPTVLILHSHGSESYEKTADYQETTPYRTLNTDYNMVAIGAQLAQDLEAAGIRVIHDQTLYDVPVYNDAYSNARAAIEKHLAENPSICLVLDLHRDAAATDSGQIRYALTTPEGETAQLMLVLGTNHDSWHNNLSLAAKLQVQLEKDTPGICRPISIRAQRYNQDLCPAVLVEVGAAGNSREEAMRATKLLAQAIISLAAGTA